MPHIRFKKNYPTLTVETGSPLMQSLLDAGIPVASSCGGEGVCSRCRIQIVKALPGSLSEPNEREKFLRVRQGIRQDERISCQTQVLGDVEIDTSYW